MTQEDLDFEGFSELAADSGLSQVELKRIFVALYELFLTLKASDLLLHEVLLRAQGEPYELPDDPKASVEYGLILYWIKHPPKQLSDIIEKMGIPEWLWKFIQKHSPTPQVTEDQYTFLLKKIKADGIVAPDGTILGENKYEQLDRDWLFAFGNYLLNIVYPKWIAPFGTQPYTVTIPKDEDKLRIMIIGDWGTGLYDEGGGYDPAKEIIDRVAELKPDYLVHLGDVYYAGTQDRLPPGEEHHNFLQLWPKQLPAGRSFTLNSNHEMYGGANGYFNIALGVKPKALTPFSHQNGTSYFALNFGDWVVVGLDAAYHDPSSLYMQGSLGDSHKYPHQYDFLQEVTKDAKQVMLLTHQTAMDTKGKNTLQLWKDVQDIVQPDYWYWGHIHLGVVYSEQSSLGKKGVKARCVGHSAIPFGNAWEFENSDEIAWYAHTPAGIPEKENLCKNGFAMLTLGSDGTIEEAFYETGNDKPVWSTSQAN